MSAARTDPPKGERFILGIESSCDETAAAVVADGHRVLSNAVHSQVELHARWRGVVPEEASRSHVQRIVPIVAQALGDAGLTPGDLHGVAVTNRPGMVGCLLVGATAAASMAWLHDLPLVGVDHIQAHIHAAWMTDPDIPLPALVLVASGGHTALWLLEAPGRSTRLGTTRDDAAGEALDKGAAILGLGYPGGPAIEQASRDGDRNAAKLPRSMLAKDSLDFSFSGLKTALLYHLRGNGLVRPMPELSGAEVRDLAATYQEAVVDVLIRKLRRAADRTAPRALAIGGGVARNLRLRERLERDPVLRELPKVFPPLDLCTDNAAMVAGLGGILLGQGQRDPLDAPVLATGKGSAGAR